MISYDHKKIEKKWQRKWEEEEHYKTKEDEKKNYYLLVEFPYPSGDGLHVGHTRPYIGLDIVARKRRTEGYNVLYPMGWDSFGLPTENYAIKTGKHPKEVTKENTDKFRKQIKSLGISFDWFREINTSDPLYYKWTQWIFIQFFKKGLAYKAKMPINWCLNCRVGLSNEEVIDGRCERCEELTEKRDKEQWMLAITKYADKLIEGLKTVNYLDSIKKQQINWIGKSEGSNIDFKIDDCDETIKIFTTRADTLYGATYMVLSPEHELIHKLKNRIENWNDVEKYIKVSLKKSDIERGDDIKAKTGIELCGIKAVNPGNNKKIPIYVADYVMSSYGTGSIMAVPAHDERDNEFAKKYNIPILKVIDKKSIKDEVYTGEGFLKNSNKFDGMNSLDARKKITDFVQGESATNYKLRDWVFSRQRYWGEPIPIINCLKCGLVAVADTDLPVELPEISNYEPNENGDSPLANDEIWVNTKCPKCKGDAKRETDVMPNWAGSSWYFLRYIDPKNDKEFADMKKLKNFMPVDLYNGGMEHTTLHLLYSRFWNNFLFDEGLVPSPEPYKKRTAHGMILGEGGIKMSKSKGNVVNPDDIVNTFGADTMRLYTMFIGPFDQTVSWNSESIIGSRRFIERVWNFIIECNENNSKISDKSCEKALHRTIKKVSEDIETMNFNTAISALMIFINFIKEKKISKKDAGIYLKLIAPFTPHVTCELWNILGNTGSINNESWPSYDEVLISTDSATVPIQINGKVRDKILINLDITENDVKELALSSKKIIKWIGDKNIKKFIYIKGRIINIII